MDYIQQGILPENPFASIDPNGVGRLMEWAVNKGREVRPELEIGICGEHGGDPKSIALCHQLGLNYVSCSPFRVPIARLAAAHAAMNDANLAPVDLPEVGGRQTSVNLRSHSALSQLRRISHVRTKITKSNDNYRWQ
jgi:hypothetical protein